MMKVTAFTQEVLRNRRERARMQEDGWEYVGEGGGALWELQRGGRYDHKITDVRIAADGKGLWIKTRAFPSVPDLPK